MSEVIEILRKVGAVLTDDHFVYTTGKHGDVYINKDALYPHTQETARVGELMALACQHLKIDTVVGPATGGIILSQWVAYYLTRLQGQEVASVYAEKTSDKSFIFKRGYDAFITGKKVLVVEDIINTGYSVQKVVDVVREYKGSIAGVTVIVNRNPVAVTEEMFQAPFLPLDIFQAQSWEEAALPAEIAKRPINTTVGHGKEYLEKKGQS